jgi:hypothetical protein
MVKPAYSAWPVRSIGITLCALIIYIHVTDQGGLTELAEPVYKGVLYWALEIGSAGAALLLGVRSWAVTGWAFCLEVSACPFLGYIISRTTGLPAYTEDIGNWLEPLGVLSLIVEGSLFCLALGCLVAEHRAFTASLPRVASLMLPGRHRKHMINLERPFPTITLPHQRPPSDAERAEHVRETQRGGTPG